MRAIATVFSYCWDIYMDWGLLHDGRYLRDTLTFSPRFYFLAAFLNMMFRCLWVLPIIALSMPDGSYLKTFQLTSLLAVAELFRRWVWAILRIENEQVSNPEKYRNILEVPELAAPREVDNTEANYNELLRTII
jgi:hypothetical protein